LLEPERRPSGTQHPIAQRGHLEPRRHWRSDTLEFAHGLQTRTKLPEIAVFHIHL
jgi:hypothetical protein